MTPISVCTWRTMIPASATTLERFTSAHVWLNACPEENLLRICMQLVMSDADRQIGYARYFPPFQDRNPKKPRRVPEALTDRKRSKSATMTSDLESEFYLNVLPRTNSHSFVGQVEGKE
jgi:hypothetical protein